LRVNTIGSTTTVNNKLYYYYDTNNDLVFQKNNVGDGSAVIDYINGSMVYNNFRNYLLYNYNKVYATMYYYDTTGYGMNNAFFYVSILLLGKDFSQISYNIIEDFGSVSPVTYVYSPENISYYQNLPVKLPPTVNIYNPDGSDIYLYDDNLAHVLSYSDNNDLKYVEYYINGNLIRNITSPDGSPINDYFYYTINSSGTVTFTVKAFAELVTEKSITFNAVEKQNLAPNIDIFAPSPQNYLNNTLDLHFLAYDSDSNIDKIIIRIDNNIYKTINNINLNSYNYYESITFTPGPHNLFIEVYDEYGKYNFSQLSFGAGYYSDFTVITPQNNDNINFGDDLVINYVVDKNVNLFNYMEIYRDNNLIFNSTNNYFLNTISVDSNFSTGYNTLSFKEYFDGGIMEKYITVYVNPYLEIEVLNSKTYNPVDSATIEIYDSNSNFVGRITTDSSGKAYLSKKPDTYSLKITKVGYKENNVDIFAYMFGSGIQVLLEPTTLNYNVSVIFNVYNNTNSLIPANNELKDISNGNIYSTTENSSINVYAGNYIVKIESNGYETKYISYDIFKNSNFKVYLNNKGTNNEVSIYVKDYSSGVLIDNSLVYIKKNNSIYNVIYSSYNEPITVYIPDGNYSFVAKKDNYKMTYSVNEYINGTTDINIVLYKVSAKDYINVRVYLFNTENSLVTDYIKYKIIDNIENNVYINSYFENGGGSFSIIKNRDYSLQILPDNTYQAKNIKINYDSDMIIKVYLEKYSDSYNITPSSNVTNNVYTQGLINIINPVFDMFKGLSGGNAFVFVLILYMIIIYIMNSYILIPEKIQIGFLTIITFTFIVMNLLPAWLGIIFIIILAILISDRIYSKFTGNSGPGGGEIE